MTTLNTGFRIKLKPGQCMSRRIHDPTSQPIQVKIYDELHSNARMVLNVLPRH